MVIGPNTASTSRSLYLIGSDCPEEAPRALAKCGTDVTIRRDDYYRNSPASPQNRFSDGGPFDLESLWFWGQLWLLLGAIDESEESAMAICAFRLREHERVYKILALKLFALVASKRKLPLEIKGYVASLYGQLWPGYTPKEELEDRKQIDDLPETVRNPYFLNDWDSMSTKFKKELLKETI